MLDNAQSISDTPTRNARSRKSTNPEIHPTHPVTDIASLNIGDHHCLLVVSTVQASLKTLHAAGATACNAKVLAFIAISSDGCRETLAFDRQECIKIVVTASINPDNFPGRCHREINTAGCLYLIGFLNAKLKNVPAISLSGDAIQMRAELRRQMCLGVHRPPSRPIPPNRKLMRNKFDECGEPSLWSVKARRKTSGLDVGIVVRQHSEPLRSEIGENIVAVSQGNRAQPIAKTIGLQ
jgi:hypothetical protein